MKKKYENKFWSLIDEGNSIVFCSQENEESDKVSIIDINDPELKIKDINNSLIGDEFDFEKGFPERSQLLYRKSFYLRLNRETEENLKMLRDFAFFMKK